MGSPARQSAQILTLLGVVALLSAACGGGAAVTPTTSQATTTTVAPATTTTSTPATTSTSQATTTSTVAATTTTAGPATTTSAPAATTTTLAGQPIDFGPAEGDVLMVIGVRHDDVLNLRAGPGTNQQTRAEIPPTYDDLEAQGNTRELPVSFWTHVDYDGTVGWVSMRYVGYEGDVTDATSTVVAELGDIPIEPTMSELAEVVSGVFASDEPESNIVQVTPVSGGDLAEVSYDVIGLGDDAVGGVRLHIFAEKASGGFSLKTVEVTTICSRGVDPDRACV